MRKLDCEKRNTYELFQRDPNQGLRPAPTATGGEGGEADPPPLNFQWGASLAYPLAPGTSWNRSSSKNDVDRPNGWAEILILKPKIAKQHLSHDLEP